ncbi:hypothetical protein GSI_05793 [Ganoderma sinense ZZ0214-1]|uniref:Uncharacterized protein n=1 Tax=Ganoderma sinense ZZ0214-1 TaxID=1077348 RepID=A0A2G8SBF6_9APHY|nr:hypothetical protein GSI_05793 [Ganoderma sinense ZZ0214-1]
MFVIVRFYFLVVTGVPSHLASSHVDLVGEIDFVLGTSARFGRATQGHNGAPSLVVWTVAIVLQAMSVVSDDDCMEVDEWDVQMLDVSNVPTLDTEDEAMDVDDYP